MALKSWSAALMRADRADRRADRRSEEGGGLGGARRRDIVVLRSLTWPAAPSAMSAPRSIRGETASDLNIGTSILRHFLITTDFPNHAIWLEPHP